MITIGDKIFEIPSPPAMRSFALQQSILPVAGRFAGVLAQVLGAGNMEELLKKEVVSVLPSVLPGLGEIFSMMPPGELERITRTLLADATCAMADGAKVRIFAPAGSTGGDLFDSLLKGKTIDIWRLLLHALEVWYPDFFGRARVLFVAAKGKAKDSEASTT